MRWCRLSLLVLFMSCNSKKQLPPGENNLQRVVDYLKKDFKVLPDVKRFDSLYLKDLATNKKSLEVDSLIASKIKIDEYKPLKLNFVLYDNYYRYSDRKSADYFTVYLVQDLNTGKFYTDFVNDKAGLIVEAYCGWSKRDNMIKAEKNKQVSAKDAAIYNSIYTRRIFGEQETRLKQNHTGIQLYLNDAYHFKQPSFSLLDSLFDFYDKNVFAESGTLMQSPDELFHFITDRVTEIKSKPDYGNRTESLIYLKDQVNLLLLQTSNEQQNVYFRIYKNHANLRVRNLLIKGNSTSGFSYFIDEYSMCFW